MQKLQKKAGISMTVYELIGELSSYLPDLEVRLLISGEHEGGNYEIESKNIMGLGQYRGIVHISGEEK